MLRLISKESADDQALYVDAENIGQLASLFTAALNSPARRFSEKYRELEGKLFSALEWSPTGVITGTEDFVLMAENTSLMRRNFCITVPQIYMAPEYLTSLSEVGLIVTVAAYTRAALMEQQAKEKAVPPARRMIREIINTTITHQELLAAKLGETRGRS